ncbi:TPA: hypothetical protein ACGSTA_001154 [Enterobacter cloacae]
MKIRWVNVYYPLGEWKNESGEVVAVPDGFRATLNDKNLIVIMRNSTSSGGHGEPSIMAKRPEFIDEDNLEFVKVDGEFITMK